MIKFYDIQKKVNRTIKDGLQNLQSFIEEAKKERQQMDDAFEYLVCTICAVIENREERNTRERKYARALSPESTFEADGSFEKATKKI